MSNFLKHLQVWLKDEKTRFDIIDRLKGLIFLATVMWLVKLLLDLLLKT